jgi:hypothetical protein
MFLWYPVLDLARAPRRAARKKSSGYENGSFRQFWKTFRIEICFVKSPLHALHSYAVYRRAWIFDKIKSIQNSKNTS